MPNQYIVFEKLERNYESFMDPSHTPVVTNEMNNQMVSLNCYKDVQNIMGTFLSSI